jgi:apolipoprotein N-acyltransferase
VAGDFISCFTLCVLRKRQPNKLCDWLGYGFGLWFVGAFWLYTSIHVYGDTNAF